MIVRAWILGATLAACASPPSAPTGVPYLDDAAFRRAELVASLVAPDDGYAQLRLARYARPDGAGWDALPEWNPLGLALDDTDPLDPAALRALGERAFFHYPMELIATALPIEAYGGARVEPVDGAHGLTCATCHATDATTPGVANARFELGRLVADAGLVARDAAPAFRAWGPGRVDVTTPVGAEPVKIPDLRPIRDLPYLQADATVRQRDLATLAIRIETLIITSLGEQHRPPRVIALALATYLWSLADALPPIPDATARGAAVFAAACAGCHVAPSYSGEPIAIDAIGTDPVVGRSAIRGTGMYRVPSLRGVGQRALLLHDGALPSLEAMFDPARLDAGYVGGVRPGPVVGHEAGLDLAADARADLLAYLRAL